ncbi:hypothetical protein M0805_008824 [Coniferiporia weirii]|nr:hypothetical protein M0805_008824 [Coniferiporia weirii]
MYSETDQDALQRHHQDLDMDLDDALREAAAALTVPVEDEEVSWSAALRHRRNREHAAHSGLRISADFDELRQYWPSSGTTDYVPAPRRHVPDVQTPAPQERPIGDFPVNPSRNHRRPHHSRRHRPRVAHDPPAIERVDLNARNSLRDVIFSAIMADNLVPSERVALLEDCQASAETSNLGIPFREILSEPMDPLDVPPLMYELMGCQPDWGSIAAGETDTGLEMAFYLIEHWAENVLARGKMGMLTWVVRTACLRRFDEDGGNRLFQQLRPAIFKKQCGSMDKYVDYEISVAPLAVQPAAGVEDSDSPLDFVALISLPYFATYLSQVHDAAQSEHTSNYEPKTPTGRKPLPPDPSLSRFAIDFLAAHRIWRLEIDSNALKLELVDGPGVSVPCSPEDEAALYVDSRVKIVAPSTSLNPYGPPQNDEADVELLLPRALLRPIAASGRGTHAVKLTPCFSSHWSLDYTAPRGFDDARFLHDPNDMLLLELTVRIAHDPFADPPPRTIPVLTATPVRVPPREEPVAGPSNTTQDPSVMPPEASAAHEDDDIDDLYITEHLGDKLDVLSLDGSDGWEEVSQVDETEDKDGSWVKASWSGKDRDI